VWASDVDAKSLITGLCAALQMLVSKTGCGCNHFSVRRVDAPAGVPNTAL
jgi:hypothetical protein